MSHLPVDNDQFEWLVHPKSLLNLKIKRASMKDMRAIDLGSGSSSLSQMLVELDYGDVHTIDIIGNKTRRDVTHHVFDLCSRDKVPVNKADLITDKSTLDFLLSDRPPNEVANYLRNITLMLKRGGVFTLVSFHQMVLVEKLLNCAGLILLNWSLADLDDDQQFVQESSILPIHVSSDTNPDANYHGNVFVYNFTKAVEFDDVLDEDISSRVRSTLDNFFSKENPLLTATRLKNLKDAWGDADALLPVLSAYEIMFTGHEREQYDVDLFFDDLRKFRPPHSSTISLDEAIKFLRENQ